MARHHRECPTSVVCLCVSHRWSKSERGASVRANFEEASSWVAHRKGLVVAEVASVGILKSNPAKY